MLEKLKRNGDRLQRTLDVLLTLNLLFVLVLAISIAVTYITTDTPSLWQISVAGNSILIAAVAFVVLAHRKAEP